MKSLFKSPVIILANGLFPSTSTPLELLENAGTVICTDGAINKLEKLGLMPHIIIGDLDSMDSQIEFKGLIVHDTNQYNTDLEKSLDWAILNNVKIIVALGKIAFDSCIFFFKSNYNFVKKTKFSHGVTYKLPNNMTIIGCYHPSPRNVNTGRINEKKMTYLFKKILKKI